MLGGDDPMGV